MYNLDYDPNTLKVLYEINKETNTSRKQRNIPIKEVVKQGRIFAPVIWCAETFTVNNMREEVKYRYGEIKY